MRIPFENVSNKVRDIYSKVSQTVISDHVTCYVHRHII